MKRFFSLLLLIFCMDKPGSSQIQLIKATSDKADIRDGLHFKKDALKISTGVNKYYIELPHKDHRVFFYTDMDSIHFDVSYGGVYNFAILLNGKDTCFAQLIASPEKHNSYISPHDNNTADTIPFTLKNNKIYLQGSVNQANSVNLLFDLGEKAIAIKKPGIKKVKNQISIAGIRWDSVEVTGNSLVTDDDADAIIGNSLFNDKIVKIDYDNKRIIVYHSPPQGDTGYSRHELILDNNTIPLMQAGIATKDTSCMTWFAIGTGSPQNSFVDKNTAAQYNLYKGSNRYFSWNKKVYVKFPELRVANLSFLNISSTLGNKNNATASSELGNGLMKRFNIILDNQNGYIYLKPNSLRNSPYDNTFLAIYSLLTGIVIALILLLLFSIRFFRRRRRNNLLQKKGYDDVYYPESAT